MSGPIWSDLNWCFLNNQNYLIVYFKRCNRSYQLSWSMAIMCLNETKSWLDKMKIRQQTSQHLIHLPIVPSSFSLQKIQMENTNKTNEKNVKRISVTFHKWLKWQCDDRNRNGSKCKLHTNIDLNVVAFVVGRMKEKAGATAATNNHSNKVYIQRTEEENENQSLVSTTFICLASSKKKKKLNNTCLMRRTIFFLLLTTHTHTH